MEIISSFTIINTSNGYMVEYKTDEGNYQYVSSPDGDNTFIRYPQAVMVLMQYLLKGLRL